MTSAKLKLPNGTALEIEGTPDEVTALVKMFSGPDTKTVADAARGQGRGKHDEASKAASGPAGYIRSIKAEGFFNSKRTISDVRSKLEEIGHIYPLHDLSKPLLRLVRSHDLRRIKEGGNWKYVNP